MIRNPLFVFEEERQIALEMLKRAGDALDYAAGTEALYQIYEIESNLQPMQMKEAERNYSELLNTLYKISINEDFSIRSTSGHFQ